MNHQEELKAVAGRLKGLREMLHIPTEEMAKAVNIPHEEYLKCENGERDLAFSFLYNSANYMGVDVGEIITGTGPRLQTYTICRKGDGLPIRRRNDFRYSHLAAALKNRLAEPCIVHIDYDPAIVDEPIFCTTHNGQELDYVLRGSMKFQVGNKIEILHTGDSIYFDASKAHGMVALDGDCKLLSVVMRGNAPADEVPIRVDTRRMERRQNRELRYLDYVTETLDENGVLTDISFQIPEHFNFAYDVIDYMAEKNPEKTALVWESNTHDVKQISFGMLSKRSNQTANYFKSLGIQKGDKVMLILKRHYEFWYAILALHKIGAVAIPATNQLTEKDLVYRFNAAGVKAIVCTADGCVSDAVEQALPESKTVTVKIMVHGAKDGWLDFKEGIREESTLFVRPEGADATHKDDPMLMYFTSGTTGYPKIAAHSFTYPIGHAVTARWWHNVNPDGLHFTISDTGWAKAMWGKLYGQWLCEGAIFAYDFDRFHADDILKMFEKHKITTFCAPPTMYRMFIKEDLSKYDLSSLEYSTTAGEALNPEVYNRWLEYTGLKIMEGFGQTETTLTLLNLVGTEPQPGSMGKPNPQYHVQLVNSEGKQVPPGEVGEVVINTKAYTPCGMFQGYYQDEEQTSACWHDGLYHTGDTAWMDEEGFFWYVGRTDDIIKSSGYRIGPFEIESVIMEIPYVLECAITGVPDPIRGQVVKATIVLTKGTQASEELQKEVQTYVKERTAPYKYPRVVEFVEELPKTISGKIRRIEIREKDIH